LLESIPAWAFLVYLFTDVLIAFGQALGDLYLSRDMPILLSMPLRVSNVVFAKFVLGVAQNEVYAAVFLLPFALGYLLGVGAAWWTLPLAALAVFIFPAVLYAALIVVTIGALRFVPARIAKEALWLVGASVPTAFWFLSFYRAAHLTGNVSTMRLPSLPDWLPSTWIGNALTMLGEGERGAAFAWLIVLFGVSLAVCPVALTLASSAFQRGLSAATSASGKRAANARVPAGPSTPTSALVRKDIKTFLRSPQLWFNHISALGFVGYLLIGHAVRTPLLPLTPQLALVQVGFVSLFGAINPGMTALSLEHLAIWILRAAPVAPSEIVAAKFCMVYVQTGSIAGIGAIALGLGYRFGSAWILALVAMALLASASAVCVGLAFDAAYPSFTWDNPNQINRGIRMVVPFLINVAALIACATILYAVRRLVDGPDAVALSLLGCAALYMLIAYQALAVARRDIAALEV
jgi:ABC-2 type transport system permease protein